MPKEEQEKKKPGIVRRIFKWIGLGLLTVLIILGLVFQAPWKVTTLLAIILLACTILPKQLRKWFWLSVGVVVIALVVWVFLPEADGEWRPYTFDEELAALEAKRAVPNSENAARIYNELLEIPFPDGNEPKFFVRSSPSTKSGPWLSKDHPKMGEWLEEQEGIIQKLMEASKIEECRFPMAADSVKLSETMDRLVPMRQWAYLLISAANNDIAEGRTEEGFQKYIAVLQMSKHLHQQPTNLDMIVGIAIEALALGQFNRFAVTGDATEERLIVIEEALAKTKHDWTSDLARILEGEKLLTKNILYSTAYEINPKGKIRLSRDPTAAMRRQFPEERPPLAYWQRKLIKASTVLSWFYIPSTPQKAAEFIDAVYERLHAMAEPDFDWKKEPQKFPMTRLRANYRYLTKHIADMSGKAFYRIHDLYLRVTTDKKGSRLIIALRRYKNRKGRWPESLDDIKSLAPAEIFVDPFNNGSFVYKLTDDSFILYSRGKNNIDEKGWYKDGADDWPIWPHKSRKTKEKKADAEQQ